MLPTLVETPHVAGEWVHEVKFDGYRTQLIIQSGKVQAFSRNGHDWAAKYPGIVNAALAFGLNEASFVQLTPVQREMWEIAENLFRVDLSKDQRDDHIRHYAELIEEREAEEENLQSRQNVVNESKRRDGRGHRKQAFQCSI